MNAKEAILEELGDLFSFANDEQERTDGTPSEDNTELLVSEEEIADLKPFHEVEEVEEEEQVTVSEEDSDSDAQEGFQEPTQMTEEECAACIEAASEALLSRDMPKEIFDWGLDYIRKMGEIQCQDILNDFATLEADGLDERLAAKETEEETLEESEKEQFLRR